MFQERFRDKLEMEDSLSIIEEELEQLSVTTGEISATT